jgi:hypothetical protein
MISAGLYLIFIFKLITVMKTKIFSICCIAVCFFSAHGFTQSATFTINCKPEIF